MIQQVLALSQPQLIEQPGMVYELWHDGEITLTKSGELYRQRTLHPIVPGFRVSLFPAGIRSIAIDERDIAKARAILASLAGVEDKFVDCLPGQSQTTLYDEINRRNTLIHETGETNDEA